MVTETRQPDAQGKARLGDGISELYMLLETLEYTSILEL